MGSENLLERQQLLTTQPVIRNEKLAENCTSGRPSFAQIGYGGQAPLSRVSLRMVFPVAWSECNGSPLHLMEIA